MPDQRPTFVVYNVNEDGAPYERDEGAGMGAIEDALSELSEFPNDTVVICLKGSPTDINLTAEVTT